MIDRNSDVVQMDFEKSSHRDSLSVEINAVFSRSDSKRPFNAEGGPESQKQDEAEVQQ